MSKEAKPIAVVYVQKPFDDDQLRPLQDALADSWRDYHVVVVPAPDQQRVFELEVFYDKNFTDTNYEDLKKWITDYLTPTNT